MPVVLIQDGFKVRIYTHDHRPPHVHVVKANEEIIIDLGSETEPLAIREVCMNRPDARRAVAMVEERRLFLLRKWREVHG